MYESFYGLNSKPFQLTPDPSFFFESKLHKRAMSYLQFGLSHSEGFIVITGGIGTGKTTVANSLLDDIQEDIVAAQIVTPKLTPNELVKMVAAKLQIDITGLSKADILNRLEKYLADLHREGKRALLVVDEAQNLPLESIEELRMLSNFQIEGRPLLQSFLLGQDDLKPILRSASLEQFRQRIVASCHLSALSEDETRGYIEHRLQQSGWQGDAILTDEGFHKVYDFTSGTPRKINTVMDRLLLYGFLEKERHLDGFAVDTVIEEIREEMFIPDSIQVYAETLEHNESEEERDVKDIQYYKSMLNELVTGIDNTINHKIKLTRYIDKLLNKKQRMSYQSKVKE